MTKVFPTKFGSWSKTTNSSIFDHCSAHLYADDTLYYIADFISSLERKGSGLTDILLILFN